VTIADVCVFLLDVTHCLLHITQQYGGKERGCGESQKIGVTFASTMIVVANEKGVFRSISLWSNKYLNTLITMMFHTYLCLTIFSRKTLVR